MFLGLDGGGSKTVAVVVSREGEIIGWGKGGPSNYQTIGIEKAINAILTACQEALNPLKGKNKITYAVLGIAGADRPQDKERIEKALREHQLFACTDFIITSDAHIALVGAMGEEFGVILIAGTGSIAFGIGLDGRCARADGWGYLLGDEGSGYWIAVEALRAVMRAFDQRGPSTSLTELILKGLDLSRAEDLVEWVYYRKPSIDTIARLSSKVFDAAASGDKIALNILRRAGAKLAQAAVSVVRNLDLVDKEFPFAVTGGLFNTPFSAILTACIRRVLTSTAPRARWVPPKFPPEIGAVILGCIRRKDLTGSFLHNLSSSYQKLKG